MKKVSLFLSIFLGFILTSAAAVKYPAKLSKWNAKRHVRTATNYIVLHTTEGNDNSSFHAVHRYGTCNYIVRSDGTVWVIIEDNRVAKHAGRSMWYNRTNLSNTSVGIEVVGYHDKKPTAKQLAALKTLIAYLRTKYRLSEDKVVTHSMVAYDTPNQWYSKSHRGRKRCGMLFATKDVRTAMGLGNTFSSDPDVNAHRLIDADSYLANVLYRKAVSPDEIAKDKKNFVQGKTVKSDDDFEGFRVITNKGVWSIAGEEYNQSTTIYFYATGLIFTGAQLKEAELKALPVGTKVLVGYIYGGLVTKERTAYHITDGDADLPSTYYRFPDKTIRSGDKIDGTAIPPGTIVLFRK